MKHTLSSLIILFTYILLSLSDYSFYWSYMEEGHFYDTLCLAVTILLVIVCLYVEKIKFRWLITTTLSLFIIAYVIIDWQFKLPIYEYKIPLNKDTDLLLEKYSGGAISSGFLNLSALESKFLFLKKHTTIKSYDNIKTGFITVDKNYIYLSLTSYDDKKSTEMLNVKEIEDILGRH